MKRTNYLIAALSLLLCMGSQHFFAATGGKKKVKKEMKMLTSTGSQYVIVKGKKLLMEFVENAKQKNCVPQTGYILSMGLKAE